MLWIIDFLYLDLTIYLTHWLFHTPYGWPVHAVHHSDTHIDVTTAVRHHPVEALISTAVYGFAVIIVGVPAAIAAVHGAILFSASALTHTRISLPLSLERALRLVIITPDLHLSHHSTNPLYADSNFGGVLSIWDRLFGTLLVLPREEILRLRFGVRGIHQHDAGRLIAMLATPLRLDTIYNSTHILMSGDEVEVSANLVRYGKIRLRANVVRDGRIIAAHIADYPNENHRLGQQLSSFTRELEEIAQAPMPRPLFVFT